MVECHTEVEKVREAARKKWGGREKAESKEEKERNDKGRIEEVKGPQKDHEWKKKRRKERRMKRRYDEKTEY